MKLNTGSDSDIFLSILAGLVITLIGMKDTIFSPRKLISIYLLFVCLM